ncbi:MAG: hypothetical protein ACYDHU_05070 [Acidimicrobiales bacterium]
MPRDLLVVPGYFETQDPKNLEWHLATDFPGAVRLARAMQQQELANAMFHLRTTVEKTIPEVAAVLGIKRRLRWSKLTGRSATRQRLAVVEERAPFTSSTTQPASWCRRRTGRQMPPPAPGHPTDPSQP